MMILNKIFNTQFFTTFIASALSVAAYGYGVFFTGGFETHFAPAFILITVLLVMGLSQMGETPLPLNDHWLLTTALVWIAGIALTLGFATIPAAAIITSLVLLALPLSLLAFTTLGSDRKLLYACGIGLLIAVTVSGVWTFIQSFILTGRPGDQAQLPLYNPNNTASLLNLGLLPACALAVISTTWRARIAALICAALILLGLFATQSRGGLLVTATGFVLFLPVLWKAGYLQHTAGLILLVAIPVVAGASLITTPEIGAEFAKLFDSDPGEFSARIARWQSALAVFQENGRYWFGLGPGSFYEYFPAHRITGLDKASSFFVHMDPLQFLVEMGIVGIILFYLPLLWLLTAAVRLMITPVASYGETAADRIIAWVCIISLLGLYAHAHISFPFYVMAVLICAGFLFALLYHKLPPWGQVPRSTSLHPVLRAICIICILLVAACAGRIGLAQHHIKTAVQYKGFIGTQTLRNALEQARFYAPESFNEPRLLAVNYKLKMGGEIPAFPGRSPENLLNTAQTYNPQDPRIPYYRALWQAQKQKKQHVKAHFLRTALDKDPGFFPARKMLIEQLIDNERYMDAYKLIIKGARHPHQRDRLDYFRNRADWLEHKRASGEGKGTNNHTGRP